MSRCPECGELSPFHDWEFEEHNPGQEDEEYFWRCPRCKAEVTSYPDEEKEPSS